MEQKLPFSILGFDCDNGSEFLNHHLWHYFARRKEPVQFTRSRPYHKNDNAHVEQKNWTHVRCLLGYDRLENAELLEPINALYRDAWALYHNHFCPSMKLVEKRREGARQIKRYDAPKTPYHRLVQNGMLDEAKAHCARAAARGAQSLCAQAADRSRLERNPTIGSRRQAFRGLRYARPVATLRDSLHCVP